MGTNTGKCIEYGIKKKMCHICQRRKKPGKDAKTYDCRKNFSGCAKSMEPAICEDLFAKDKYKVMIGDEDSSSEARVKKNVNSDIKKWADGNHVKRTLGKTLHDSKGLDFGPGNDSLTDQVKECILLFFHCCVSK